MVSITHADCFLGRSTLGAAVGLEHTRRGEPGAGGRAHVVGKTAVGPHLVEEAVTEAPTEDPVGDAHRVVVRVIRPHADVAHGETRLVHVGLVGDEHAAALGLEGLVREPGDLDVAGRPIAETRLEGREHLDRIEVTPHRDQHVVRVVEVLVEPDHVVTGDRLERRVLGVAGVGMIRRPTQRAGSRDRRCR